MAIQVEIPQETSRRGGAGGGIDRSGDPSRGGRKSYLRITRTTWDPHLHTSYTYLSPIFILFARLSVKLLLILVLAHLSYPPPSPLPSSLPRLSTPLTSGVRPRYDDDEMTSALERLKLRRAASNSSRTPTPQTTQPAAHAAAMSHVANDAYMDRFGEGLVALGLEDPHHPPPDPYHDPTLSSAAAAATAAAPSRSRPRPRPHARISYHDKAGRGGAGEEPPGPSDRTGPHHRGSTTRGGKSHLQRAYFAQKAQLDQDIKSTGGGYPPLDPRWRRGPTDPAGTRVDLSDRPLLCGDVDWHRQEAILGGSDHALYVVDLDSGKKKRQLYSKTDGHSEWVAAVKVLSPTGTVASAGMDGKVLLWSAGSTRCSSCLVGHVGPVSCLAGVGHQALASAGYDKTVRIWPVATARGVRGTAAGAGAGNELVLKGTHRAPILCLDVSTWNPDRLASGDRGGAVAVWDINRPRPLLHLDGLHASSVKGGGHTTSLLFTSGPDPAQDPEALVTGGQDGAINVIDVREGCVVARAERHTTPKGRGAVSFLCRSGQETVVSAGADGSVQCTDLRYDLAPVWEARLSDFPYECKVRDGLVWVGCGDGRLVVYDVRDGNPLFGLGANEAAVRFVEVGGTRLVAAGDDGRVLVYAV